MKKIFVCSVLSSVFVLSACGFNNADSGDEEVNTASGNDNNEASADNTANENNNTSEEDTSGAHEEAEIVLDMSLPEGRDTKNDAGASAFREKLEELTDNEVSVNIHYSNAFGGEREVYEMMGQGTVDLALQSSGPMGVFEEEMLVFDLPYIFEGKEHARGVLDGEIGEELADSFEEAANVKILSWIENGFVVIGSAGQDIEEISDLENYTIRVQESEVQIDTWEAVGANPTPMAWPEVYTALQQGVIDGHDQAIMVLETGGFDEIQSSITITDARFVAAPISMGADQFNSMSDEHQEALIEAAEYGRDVGRETIDQMEVDAMEYLENEGGQTIYEFTDEQKEEYREMTQEVYDEWGPVIGEDLIERIQNFNQ
ncbi:TRAP transporter substrate-binding protein [Alkalicoccus saliphilus]|uniref:TRAP transporter substrate-binding protein DctP n=1 Tax=Alkalicoccus saliphilus TaxID=200989 RepID=A0A2T4U4P1_9BACI|nr:TRAP transporter substrate-binding protein [Alkalicoccus saliphilus]PTL38372.1 TRAP transporter substrate-binding protein DctP [Alkalicoccus saliphilus]